MTAAAQQTPTETVTFSYSGVPLPIFTNDANVATLANILVPKALKITNVSVKAQVEFSGVGDLNLYVFSALATRVRLLERNCGSTVNVDTTFDDAAQSKYADFCPSEPGRGPFRGNEPLANYKDQNSFGIWTLAVENNASNKIGWLTQFSVTITGTRLTSPTFISKTVVNAASYAGNVIAPGELISIYGAALGPQTAVTAPSGNWPLTLGGTQVLFNGVQVPVAYASNYRVDVQAPFLMTPGTSVDIQVKYGELSSSTVPVGVASSAPGIFTAATGGTGQAKAINQDGKLNSKVSPAARGTYISVYTAGLGAVTPPLTSGQVPAAGTLYTTTQGVAALIGGVPCSVIWAGAAPGMVGVYQVNILVEGLVPRGTQDLVLSTGGNASQSGVTVEIQ